MESSTGVDSRQSESIAVVAPIPNASLSSTPADASITISPPIAATVIVPSSSSSSPSSSFASTSDPSDAFGPTDSTWSSHSSPAAPAVDPFAEAVEDSTSTSLLTPHAFDSFPKPPSQSSLAPTEGKRKKKKGEGKKKKTGGAEATAAPSLPVMSATTSASTSAASLVGVESASVSVGAGSEEGGGGGLLLPDSAEYLAMLEQRLERLRKRQETRAKAAKTARRTSQPPPLTYSPSHPPSLCPPCAPPSHPPLVPPLLCSPAEFVSITTSQDLNEDDGRGRPTSSDEKKERDAGELIDVVHPIHPGPTGSPTEGPPRPGQHRATIGLHSSPFTEEEAHSIMETAVPMGRGSEAGEGEVEDEGAMVSSDNVPVGVMPDKTALYENLEDQQCSVM